MNASKSKDGRFHFIKSWVKELTYVPGETDYMHKVSFGPLLSIQTSILLANSKGPDQTARMRSLIWAFAVRICPKTCFHLARPILFFFFLLLLVMFIIMHVSKQWVHISDQVDYSAKQNKSKHPHQKTVIIFLTKCANMTFFIVRRKCKILRCGTCKCR